MMPRTSTLAETTAASLSALAALLVAPTIDAAFTGITVTAVAGPTSTPVGPTTIYRMWANFDAGGGNCSGVRNFRFISATGFTGFVHNDNFTAGAHSITSGSWFTIQSNSTFGAVDSWVSLTEPTSFPISSATPTGSWFPGDFFLNPQIPGISGSGVSWGADPGGPYFPIGGQQLLGQFVIASSAQICLAADILADTAAGNPSATAVTFDFNGNCIPAPGAIALIGLAGFARRRAR